MATWVRLRDRRAPGDPPVAFFNTHLDHLSPGARRESARLLRRMAGSLGEGCRIVIVGDFNSGEGGEPYRALFGDGRLVDTFRAVHPDRGEEEGTFSGFRAGNAKGDRIDWIGVSLDWEILGASIDRTARGGRTPSDHFPVTAVLRPEAGWV
jgi:endonuclease/exonuclease/phosphatase family metal-dependent hydrolase